MNSPDRKVWTRCTWAGVLPALVVQYWMLSGGTWALFRWSRISDFYDAQAHGLLHGRWAIDSNILGIEAFHHAGGTYMYQGPVPALMRLPVAVFTDRFDGRLTTLSMLIGTVVTAWACGRMGWHVRTMLAGEAPLGRADRWAAALFTASVVGGSSLLFASSSLTVFHEAITWGVAFTLASGSYLVQYLQARSAVAFRWAALFAGLAVLTRASVGLGALAALGLVGVCDVAAALRSRARADSRVARWSARISWTGAAAAPAAPADEPLRAVVVRRLWRPTVAVGVTVVTYATVNMMKFGTLFSVPWQAQELSRVDPARQQMLALNGSLFSWKFIPTNVLQYWRPDMLGFSTRWPFIGFPTKPVRVIGNLQFDLLDRTASVPAAMPLLVVLALVGAWVAVRGRHRSTAMRVPLLGAVLSTLMVVNIGYTANRYLSDFLPLLVIGAWVGLFVVIAWRRERTPVVRRTVLGVVVVAGLFSGAANLALGYFFQRAYAPNTPPTSLAGFVSAQLTVDDALGDGRLEPVRTGGHVPQSGRMGDLFVLDGCTAVYWSDGLPTNKLKKSNWNAVVRSAAGGAIDATITFRKEPAGTRQEIVSSVGRPTPISIYVEYLGGDRVRFGSDGEDLDSTGQPVHIEFGHPYHLTGWMDSQVKSLQLNLDERVVVVGTFFLGRMPIEYGGTPDGADRGEAPFSGSLTPRPIDMSLCQRLTHP